MRFLPRTLGGKVNADTASSPSIAACGASGYRGCRSMLLPPFPRTVNFCASEAFYDHGAALVREDQHEILCFRMSVRCRARRSCRRCSRARTATPTPTPTPTAVATPSVPPSDFNVFPWVDADNTCREVAAFIGGTLCATGTPMVLPGSHNTGYHGSHGLIFHLSVPSEQDKPGCGYEGATVTFSIDGQQPRPAFGILVASCPRTLPR